jgi:hypothetical protein
MLSRNETVTQLTTIISETVGLPLETLNQDTILIGAQAVVKSGQLVEILLEVEDFAQKNGFTFDWTSDSAMSQKRSPFRSVGSLADYLVELSNTKAA